MASDKKASPSSLGELFGEIENELEEEQAAGMPKEELLLADIARRMLRLERDMTMPGSQTSTSSRVDRLANFIEGENF